MERIDKNGRAETEPEATLAEKVIAGKTSKVTIEPPKFSTASILIRGTAPLVLHAFSQKAIGTMIEAQRLGQQSRSRRKREPKDFDAVYDGARHISEGGWDGIPAGMFRNGMISACRTVGFKMTLAKLSIFVEADGYDARDGTPLVKISKGEPRRHEMPARNDNGGTDIRVRPMWMPGWEANVRIRWDAEQFSASDIVNLLARVGGQVGIGEGRPDSRNSAGLGWGLFEVAN